VTANEVVPAKSYAVETGVVVLGAACTHHFEKFVLVILLS